MTDLTEERKAELLKSPGGAWLTIDGNCGCALIGENLQEGEAEFVVIEVAPDHPDYENAAKRATVQALRALEKRFYPNGEHSLPFYTGEHPFLCAQ